MPKAIERYVMRLLNHIYRLIAKLLIHLDEEKKEKDKAKRKNAQTIVAEIDKVLKKYSLKECFFNT